MFQQKLYILCCYVYAYTGYYGIYPKISYTKVSDKLAYENSAEPDQTSLSTLFAIPLSILRNNCMKKQNLGQKVWNKVFKILGHLLYIEVKKLLQCFWFYNRFLYLQECFVFIYMSHNANFRSKLQIFYFLLKKKIN